MCHHSGFLSGLKLPEGREPKPAGPLHLWVLQEELLAELVREADLFTRRDSGLQMMLSYPGSKEVSFALLPGHPGRMLVCHHWFSPCAFSMLCFLSSSSHSLADQRN